MLDLTPLWWNTAPKKIAKNPRLIYVWRVLNLIEDLNNPTEPNHLSTRTLQFKFIYDNWPGREGNTLERAYAIHWMECRAGKPF